MVLVDTSVWIDHLRRGDPELSALLTGGEVLVHPFVIGELSCGNLKNRAVLLGNLAELPGAMAATHDETLGLMQVRRLWGRGIGWVDAHLLASALLSGCALWTRDARLAEAAGAANVRRHGSA